MNKLRDVLPGAYLREEGEGYPPPSDPKILPGKPNGAARFVAKHLHGDGSRVSDVDDSTKDDKLFKASNMKRAVPEPDGDTHGHTPVGKDAAVYEAVIAKIFECGCDGKPAKKSAKKQKVEEGWTTPSHEDFEGELSSRGWMETGNGLDESEYKHYDFPDHKISVNHDTHEWEHGDDSGVGSTSLSRHLASVHGG